ncbi:integrator complex subunit 2 [Eurytemora carolleeae]|uniref:integrator complex subunit 2 n=1 Tax=Eurytemora carolleeae TaxID=1294199 RepID=UPI000C769168|nr:integrator complex subunit 2 [Eurytemora carolleeae]|eukprot:XP_023344126.1 integrator complex subunit 2-like [Eurytemora affinis]
MEEPVSPKVFRAISVVDVDTILTCSDAELRPILSCLVRMSLIAPMDQSPACLQSRTSVLQVLSRIELVNSIVALLSIDFHSLELDVKKEQQLKQKLGAGTGESILITNITTGPALEFERSDPTRKLRLVLSELMTIMVKPQVEEGTTAPEKIVIKPSELFDHRVYLSEVCDVLTIALAELPALLQPRDVCEALLSVRYGPQIICHIVANQADCYLQVAFHLIGCGERSEEEEEEVRREAVLLLARMCPSHALTIRARCVDQMRLPGLSILLTLEHSCAGGEDNDMVEFMSGLILGSGNLTRNWICHYLKTGQKRKCETLGKLRQELTNRLANILAQCSDRQLPAGLVKETSTLLRLYAALRGIAGLKLVDDEINLLMEVITHHPPANPAGVHLVSLSLAVLLSCNSLISTPALEKQAIEWIKWLVREEAYFESESTGCAASFGEMLLLIAINFHAGQLSSIVDLICQTLGMKMTVRTTNMTRIKQIFINDIFPESTIAAHAVKVPVTRHLSAHVQGFLPVHCMHQLLKSRVFSKHKVSIKSWIYKQICSAAAPLHPILPALIDAYVQSILIPHSHRIAIGDQLNQPLTEQEIREIFSQVVIDSIPGVNPTLSGATPTYKSVPYSSRSSTQPTSRGSRPTRQRGESTAEDSLCVQICVLYYVLLYEDVRLANMKNILSTGRKVCKYSAELLAELPVKFLLAAAENKQAQLQGMFPSLLKLCATHFPHLCLVEDWIRVESTSGVRCGFKGKLSSKFLEKSLKSVSRCPAKAVLALQLMLDLSPNKAWELVDVFIRRILDISVDTVPRHVQELYRSVWMVLNSLYPRKLWLLTVNNLSPKDVVVSPSLTQEELSLDPLATLRCHQAVFRSGPILSIVLYMLKACLAASRTRLSQHLLNALVLTQESAAIQILLESCVETAEEKAASKAGGGAASGGCSQLTALQEIQSLICCYLHEAFIADPNLAKLVHFQGYPTSLVPVCVAGVPSMHICLDFAPELLSQPSLDKQVFAIDLISQLSVQYSLPKSLSAARLAVNSVSTLLSVLHSQTREELIISTLPAMERVCQAFPPLTEDVVSLLLQAGRMCLSSSSLAGYSSPANYDMTSDQYQTKEICDFISEVPDSNTICNLIIKSFRTILQQTALVKRIY